MDLYIARQPIFDSRNEIFGYELLYRRRGRDQHAELGDPSQMSSDVIVQSFLELGLDRLTGGKHAFVNFGRELLLSGAYRVLDPASVVIELLEDVDADAEVTLACQELVTAGYTLALDDYISGGSQRALLPLASIVKLDLLGRSTEEIRAQAAALLPHGVRLLAERVEDECVHQAARMAGFTHFQGYYFSRPETVAHSGTSVEALRIFPLMNALQDETIPDSRIEEMFRRDPSLSHKLLRIANSAKYGGRGIDSILQALRMVGRGALYRWMILLLTSSLATGGEPSQELVRTTLIRARLLELLAREARANMGALFLAGMFSNLDTLLCLSMPELLGRVALAPEVRDSLLRQPGSPYLRWLELVEAYERGQWETATLAAEEIEVDPQVLPDLYLAAVEWASEMVQRQAT